MQKLDQLRSNIRRCFMGNQQAIDNLIVCLLARGHMLIEDVPGVGKTMIASALARSLDCTINRIQMTPDMMPSDVLGVTVWDQQQSEFIFKPGPIFSNVVLADEINRTTPRTQSALLEAMNEGQVSIDGKTRQLIDPFIVIATQNPFEFEGTYFLPESQLDRFLMRISLGYPSPADEARMAQINPSRTELRDLKPVMTADELVKLQDQVSRVHVEPVLMNYAVSIAGATRNHEQVQVGVSPRGTLALLQAARATAMLNDRDYAIPEDITSNAISVLSHRIIVKTYTHDGDGIASHRLMHQILESVPSPV